MNNISRNSKINIDLEIEELVLDGFAEQDKDVIAEALKGELTRLISQGEFTENVKQNTNIERLDGGSIQIANGFSGGEIGKQAAQSLYGGMQK
jgi:hypothetical protein